MKWLLNIHLIKVHEIDWLKRKILHPFTQQNEMNTISIYFQKILQKGVLCPNEDKICDIFEMDVGFYNIGI